MNYKREAVSCRRFHFVGCSFLPGINASKPNKRLFCRRENPRRIEIKKPFRIEKAFLVVRGVKGKVK